MFLHLTTQRTLAPALLVALAALAGCGHPIVDHAGSKLTKAESLGLAVLDEPGLLGLLDGATG